MRLKLMVAIYVIAIPITHMALPDKYVWHLALLFLLLMLPPYLISALRHRAAVTSELLIAISLALLGIIGFLTKPVLLIAAIFVHGCWDLAKHNGWGTPFYRWYISGCVIVDWLYSGALVFYLLSETGRMF